mmetsp:Transcript_101558/g.293905  ORF Transcript_101558/g.293905 Transcript_101558/m.293905 type:complete len:203 (-) Transcript_101558:2614-3222(-)
MSGTAAPTSRRTTSPWPSRRCWSPVTTSSSGRPSASDCRSRCPRTWMGRRSTACPLNICPWCGRRTRRWPRMRTWFDPQNGRRFRLSSLRGPRPALGCSRCRCCRTSPLAPTCRTARLPPSTPSRSSPTPGCRRGRGAPRSPPTTPPSLRGTRRRATIRCGRWRSWRSGTIASPGPSRTACSHGRTSLRLRITRCSCAPRSS